MTRTSLATHEPWAFLNWSVNSLLESDTASSENKLLDGPHGLLELLTSTVYLPFQTFVHFLRWLSGLKQYSSLGDLPELGVEGDTTVHVLGLHPPHMAGCSVATVRQASAVLYPLVLINHVTRSPHVTLCPAGAGLLQIASVHSVQLQ